MLQNWSWVELWILSTPSQSILSIYEVHEELFKVRFLGVLVYLYHLDNNTTRAAWNLMELYNDMDKVSPYPTAYTNRGGWLPKSTGNAGETSH
jgi:hypothetical protein